MDPRLGEFVAAVRASPHNLMSPRASAELEERHIPECRALARLLPEGPGALVDVGSGGGLPGLVIAIERPDLEVTLVESTRKKATFLTETAQRLGLDLRVVNARVEESPDLRGSFDLATARAVAPLDRLVRWAVPLLRPGGAMYAVKGRRWRDEVRDAAGALRAADATTIATPDDPRARDESVDPPLRVVIIGRH